jgi:hypothetical protein
MNPNDFAAQIAKLTAIPLDLAASANAKASTTAVMLRLLLQQLVENKLIDGAALAERLKTVAAQAHFDSVDVPDAISASAQHTADKVSASFLNDLLPQALG